MHQHADGKDCAMHQGTIRTAPCIKLVLIQCHMSFDTHDLIVYKIHLFEIMTQRDMSLQSYPPRILNMSTMQLTKVPHPIARRA